MYSVCEKMIETEDRGYLLLYGLTGEGRRIDGVSTSRAEMERLAEQCNRLGLSPVHLRDVISDFLGR